MPSPSLADLASRLDVPRQLEQQGRLLLLDTALPHLALIAERLVLREAVNQPFELVLDALSSSRHLQLKALIGEQISVRRLMPDGSYAPWHGYVTEAAQLGADGGLARYRLTMRPWLSFLGARRDSRVFQDQTALEIVQQVFAQYPQARYELRVTEPLRQRSLCVQYRESDLAFVQRLLAEEGLSYHFQHLQADAAATADADGQARHALIVCDRLAVREHLGDVRFALQHASANLPGQRDAITAFSAARSLAANAVTLGSWDYKALAATGAQATSTLALGELPALEVYDGAGAYRYENPEHAQRAADLALAALELQAKQFEGQGSARHLCAGARFTLTDHPLYGSAGASRTDNAFVVLAVEHHASNNLGGQLGGGIAQLNALSALERGSYQCHFHCAPAAAALVPAFIRKPSAFGIQSALVVGAPGEHLTTERDLRVKIQFPWQRGPAPLAGGLALEGGNAPRDAHAGTWVRVAQPSAGAHWGAVFVPRIGTEVAVQFIDGDIDRPLVLGQLHNGEDAPPFAAGIDAGVNHPGVLSGLHSHTLDAGGFNQWVLDDASGQLRMRLATSSAQAQLNLGHLIAQAGAGAQRGGWRGAGLEARTAGWASLRAGQGLLVSSSARQGSYASAQSTQMDASEAVAQLQAARDLGSRLSQAAVQAGAHPLASTEAGQALERFTQAIDLRADGKHPGPVNGQPARQAGPDGRTLQDDVHAFAQPQIVLDTPSRLIAATEAGIAAYASQDSSLLAQGDLHQAAAHTYAQVSGGTSSLYAHQGGVRAIAANGPVSIRAHTDALQLWADQSVTVVSVNEEIRISAKEKIELVGGQSSLVLQGGDVTFSCPGRFEVKGASHAFLGGSSQGAQLQALPVGLAGEVPTFMELNLHDEWLQPVPGAPYVVVFEDGTRRAGTLDANGHARLDGVPNLRAEVFYGEDPRDPEPRVQMPANTLQASATTNEEAIANIERAQVQAERFWAEQATAEQREVRAMLAEPEEPQGESLWHYLDAERQQALEQELRGAA